MNCLKTDSGCLTLLLPVAGLLLSLSTPAVAQSDERAIFLSTYDRVIEGYVSSMRVRANGSLRLVDVERTNLDGSSRVRVSPDGRHVAVKLGGRDPLIEQLEIFAVNHDATLTPVQAWDVPNTIGDLLWLRDDLLVVSQYMQDADDYVVVYRFDQTASTLTEVDRQVSGGRVGELALHPHGHLLYANDSTTGDIWVYEVGDTGRLTKLVTNPNGFSLFGMTLTSDGRRFYTGTGSRNDKLSGFEVDQIGGHLSNLPRAPYTSPLEAPNETAVSSDDRFLFAGHTEAIVHVFDVNPDGSLTITNFSATIGSGLLTELGDLAVMDDLLFATDILNFLGTRPGVLSYRINQDGSLDMIGNGSFHAGFSAPQHMATWNPAKGIYLEAGELVTGQSVTFEVTGATPNAPIALVYSRTGGGHTPINRYNITLGLVDPIQIGNVQTTNSAGEASWTFTVPPHSLDIVWFQVAQFGRVSNVVAKLID